MVMAPHQGGAVRAKIEDGTPLHPIGKPRLHTRQHELIRSIIIPPRLSWRRARLNRCGRHRARRERPAHRPNGRRPPPDVYAAKPVAIDVPGALIVQAAGKLAQEKKLVYHVDYQIPTDPVNIEVVKRIHEGALGRLMHIDSMGFSSVWPVSRRERYAARRSCRQHLDSARNPTIGNTPITKTMPPRTTPICIGCWNTKPHSACT
jgi:hypothetical protein